MRFHCRKAKFCVVTPTIPGRARLLRAAIRSVKAQTFKDYLHVVCGDGDNPEGEAIAREEGATWTSIPKAGGWGYGCRNHVVANWEADYFMFLDDDNVYKPECLKEVNEASVGNPPFLAIQIDWIARWLKPPQRWVIPGEPKVEKGYYDQMCSIIRSDVAKKVRFKNTYEQDFEFATECLALAGNMTLIRKVLGVYSWSWEEDHAKDEGAAC
jgi:glycosyltransferase involved in cell wall biosynthesis